MKADDSNWNCWQLKTEKFRYFLDGSTYRKEIYVKFIRKALKNNPELVDQIMDTWHLRKQMQLAELDVLKCALVIKNFLCADS